MNKQFFYTERTRGESFTTSHDAILNEDHVKQCSCCGEYMREGYVIGDNYYCDTDCLEMENTKEEIEELQIGEDGSDNYWTV